jgi:P27 family predicted phage terminase small subunit
VQYVSLKLFEVIMPNPRKPTNMKVIEGTFRTDRANPDEPRPAVEIPSCPAQLSAGAKREWYRIAALLEEMGLVAKVNRASLAAYCSLYARWIKAESEIAAEGEIYKVITGEKRAVDGTVTVFYSYKKSPWVDIALKCAVEMRHFANEFGLTPASQSKVSAKPKEKADPKAKSTGRFFK